jgi:hypothetical protein
LRAITAGGESHPALRTSPSSIDGGDFFNTFFSEVHRLLANDFYRATA